MERAGAGGLATSGFRRYCTILGEEDQLLRNVAGISCYVSCLRDPQHSGD